MIFTQWLSFYPYTESPWANNFGQKATLSEQPATLNRDSSYTDPLGSV
ncbi:MAG: hypothetical protein F6K50_34075 [Moorea sp. SIO3I7]|nr:MULTISPECIES: hypothetical protein [unclassified Moorena]NEO00308.1 hypothetical protein [Moorena sp. SIO3I7]NEO08547.1 hypothetical protein [Moorena sp. SIO3I8]NEO21854.1 hypothetical protein [Moorena sp. SIO4A5]NEP28520.1 hypothetical protein [Moorena sp. SIO3I6]NEQ59301.1 hypothetical protein [Moorena sp. SIO4A1]